MRYIAMGLCVTFATALSLSSANAAPISKAIPAAETSMPVPINDHDGGFIPIPSEDRNFAINPDGATAASYSGNADQDEDGSDIAIYQGEDDQLPS